MLFKILIGIIVSVVCTAIGRGIVFALGLDAMVARVIQQVLKTASDFPEIRNAIAWPLAGLIGLGGLSVWLLLRVDEKLYNAFSPTPALGSLQFVEPFVATFARNIASGQTDAVLVAKLHNANEFLVRFRAVLQGEVNGKAFANVDGTNSLTFEGYVSQGRPTELILRIPDIPAPPPQSRSIALKGLFSYDVTYFAAPSAHRTRRTIKRISFEVISSLSNAPGSSGTGIHVLFLEEKEE